MFPVSGMKLWSGRSHSHDDAKENGRFVGTGTGTAFRVPPVTISNLTTPRATHALHLVLHLSGPHQKHTSLAFLFVSNCE